jgi:hypothetical protein
MTTATATRVLAAPPARVGRLIERIRVEHGPHHLLGRFFLAADRAAADRGIRLYLRHDFDEFVAFNERMRGGKYKLGIFHPAYSTLGEGNAYWIEGLDRSGRRVATQAGRLFEWRRTSLAEELCALRMFYADPATDALPDEHCTIESASAPRIRGRVTYSGGSWYDDDFRGCGLSAILPRISRAYAYTRWASEFTISFVEDVLVRKSVVKRYGYTNVEPGIRFRKTLMADMDLNLVWMDTAEMLADLAAFVSAEESGRADEGSRRDYAIPA